MKKTFTLAALIVLVSVFAYGKIPELKNSGKIERFKTEKQIKTVTLNGSKAMRFHLFRNEGIFSQNTRLKSGQTVRQRLDSFEYLNWDEATSLWVTNMKYDFGYEATGNTQFVSSEIDPNTGQLINTQKQEYIYNTNGDKIQSSGYEWNTNIWLLTSKNEFTYNANRNLIQDLTYMQQDVLSPWVVFYKVTYDYDANGNRTLKTEYVWDDTTLEWIKWSGVEYTYNANSNITQELNYELDYATFNLTNTGRSEYTYDAKGNKTQYVNYMLDHSTGLFTKVDKSEYTYDASGNMSQEFIYSWDIATSQWIANYKDEYNYNNSYSSNDLILPEILTENGEYFNHMLTGFDESDWDSNTSQWILSGKYQFNYSEQNATSIASIYSNSLKIYPNPASEYIHLDLSEINGQVNFELFDIRGRKVLSVSNLNEQKINLEGLTSGVYFYNIINNGNNHNGKLIKE